MNMNLDQLIARAKAALNEKIAAQNNLTTQINQLRATDGDSAREAALLAQRSQIEAERAPLEAHLAMLEKEKAGDDAIDRLQREITPIGQRAGSDRSTDVAIGITATPRADRSAGTFVRSNDGERATVAREQRVADHPIAARMIDNARGQDQAIVGQHGTLGNMLRAMTTTSGSAIVPTVWAAQVIDKARNYAAVLRAGAQIVPMDAKIVQIGRLTGDPTAAFRTEGSAITASDPTFDNVTLTAKTMSVLTIGSLEWFADSEPAGDALVEDAIAKAIALQLDKVALYGGTNVGGVDLTAAANPTGIAAYLAANASTSVLGGATNGTTQTATTFWNEILDTVYTPRDFNESPNALIWNSKAARMYSKVYDTTGQPLRTPADVEALERYVSNQVPSYTQGSMTTATDVFCGDFSQLLIGQRLDLSVQVLTERYADNGQIGIVANWRGDVGLARPRAFSLYKAIKGA